MVYAVGSISRYKVRKKGREIALIIQNFEALSPSDRKGFMAVLRQIHQILAQSSKNEFILASIKTTQGLSRRFWCYYATDEDQAYCTDLYIRKMNALMEQNEEVAVAASEELITYLQNFTKAQLERFRSE